MMVVLASADRAVAGCNFAAMGEGRVDNVIDGRTIRLVDGREVRLAGIEIATTGTAHTTATAALAQLVT